MKKTSLLLAAILGTTSAFGATDLYFARKMEGYIARYCLETISEDMPFDTLDEAEKACLRVAECVVNNAIKDKSLPPDALNKFSYVKPMMLKCAGEVGEDMRN